MRPDRVLEQRRRKLVAALGGATLLAALLAAPSGAASRTISFSATNCREIGSFFFLPLDVLDPYVPDELTVASVWPGLGEVLVLTATCDELAASKSRRPLMFSEVGIYVEKADSSPSWHYYGLWHATDQKQLNGALSRLGVKAHFVRDMSFSSSTGTIDAEANVPLAKGAYRMQALVPSSSGLLGARPSTWWYKTRNGYVRVVYEISAWSGRAGTGRFKSEPGTALAELLGTSEREIHSTILEDYPELSATVTRVRL